MRYRGTRKALVLSAFIAGASLSVSPPVDAAAPAAKPAPPPPPSPEKTRAAELFKKGSDAYMKGDFTTAIANLEEAYKLDPQPVLVYNQARAHEGLGHTDQAIQMYEQYLREEPTSPDRGAIEQRLTTLKKQRDERAAAERERAQLEKERAARANEPPPPPPPKTHSKLPYVLGGVGIAGIGAGVVFGVLAKGKESDGESAKTQRAAVSDRDSGQTMATVANISFIAGGVLLVAGAIWWAVDHSGGSPKNTGTRGPLVVPRTTWFGPGLVGGTF
jgi:tetratricopeptide (TPR) repeat protein